VHLQQAQTLQSRPQGEGSRRRRLLVVDDHTDSRTLLVRLLAHSYEVSAAACYDSALEEASQRPPDVVISDIGLPGRDGLELMRELNRLYGVRGVAVSGQRVEDDALQGAGFVAQLLKPILFDRLTEALAHACDGAATPAGR
jgi:CheY-like chemotaxis protein